MASLRYAPGQIDIESALEEIRKNPEAQNDYAALMRADLLTKRNMLVSDGWGFLRDGDLLRARSAFEAAQFVDATDVEIRLGQLTVDLVQKHYRRAVSKFAEVVRLDATSADRGRLFQHDFSFQDKLKSEEQLTQMISDLGQKAAQNLDQPQVQALYAFALWYSPLPNSRAEAVGIVNKLYRTDPTPDGPWTHLLRMIQKARSANPPDRSSETSRKSTMQSARLATDFES